MSYVILEISSFVVAGVTMNVVFIILAIVIGLITQKKLAQANQKKKVSLESLKQEQANTRELAQANQEKEALQESLERERAKARELAQANQEKKALQESLERERAKARELAQANQKKKALQEKKRKELENVLIVDGGKNGFKTINEALQTASDQITIRVMPGTYYESLVVNKNVTIIGIGKVEQIVVIGPEKKSAVSFTAKRARLQNITLQQKGDENPCIDISNGESRIEECNISGGKYCVAIHGTQSAPILKNNQIHNAEGNGDQTGLGIYISENARGTIEQNEIFENKTFGIMLNSDSNSIIQNNRIYKNAGGIHLSSSKSTIKQNEIFDHGSFNGIKIKFSSDFVVFNNRVYKNNVGGIHLSNSEGTIEQNEVFENGNSGIHVSIYSNPVVSNNRVYNNRRYGILISRKSKPTLSQNSVYGNGREDVKIGGYT